MIQEVQTINFYNYEYTKISFLELWANITQVTNLIGGDDIEIVDFINRLKNKKITLDNQNYDYLFNKIVNLNIFRPDLNIILNKNN